MTYDVIVIGGGPAGATAAAILAESDCSVLVLEGSKFPRFTVGEIIAPTGLWRVWNRLGFSQELMDAHFIRKWAGSWQAPDGTIFRFDQDVFPNDDRCRPFVYTVERAVYDTLHLERARMAGATVLEEARVEELLADDTARITGVRFQYAGKSHEARCKLVVDASGRANVVARKLGLRVEIDELTSFSVFAHYAGASRETGKSEGDVRIVFDDGMWFWWAPLAPPKASVGIVADRKRFFDEFAANPERFYDKYVRTCPFLWAHIANANRVTHLPTKKAIGTAGAYTGYHSWTKSLVGPGWAVIGDAGGFVDPIFSAGLYVAQTSAVRLADVVALAIAANDLSEERLVDYVNWYHEEVLGVMRHIQTFALNYFAPDFVNAYLRLGNRRERIRRLFIDTFVAHDRRAVQEYSQLIDRFFSPSGQRVDGPMITGPTIGP